MNKDRVLQYNPQTKRHWDISRMAQVANFLEPYEEWSHIIDNIVLRISPTENGVIRFTVQERVNSQWHNFVLAVSPAMAAPLGLNHWISNTFLPEFAKAREEYRNANN